MEYSLRPIINEDRVPIVDIFNHYVENSFAAYPEEKLPYGAFDLFLRMSEGFPRASIIDWDGRVVGFGMLRAHNPTPTFSHTAEATYFIHPDHTGKGLGGTLLRYLEDEARQRGIKHILANISALNEGSVRFHQRKGFIECGRFKNIVRKRGRELDIIWMQKTI